MKPEFYVGQRVISQYDFGPGTIAVIEDSLVGVRFDEPSPVFHNLGGICEFEHGYWFMKESITPIGDESATIPEYTLEAAEVLYG